MALPRVWERNGEINQQYSNFLVVTLTSGLFSGLRPVRTTTPLHVEEVTCTLSWSVSLPDLHVTFLRENACCPLLQSRPRSSNSVLQKSPVQGSTLSFTTPGQKLFQDRMFGFGCQMPWNCECLTIGKSSQPVPYLDHIIFSFLHLILGYFFCHYDFRSSGL